MSAYRGSDLVELSCPRCKKKLPPVDVATCACGGVWVTAFAATEVLETTVEDTVTRWWRVREPCPMCGEKMTLRGLDPVLFQGCDLHGYFIDADTIEHTKLARGIDYAALDRKRQDQHRVDEEREALARTASRRAAEREERMRREAEIARMQVVRVDDLPDPAWTPPTPPPPPPAPAWPVRVELNLEALLAYRLGEETAELLMRRIRQLEARIIELEKRQR